MSAKFSAYLRLWFDRRSGKDFQFKHLVQRNFQTIFQNETPHRRIDFLNLSGNGNADSAGFGPVRREIRDGNGKVCPVL